MPLSYSSMMLCSAPRPRSLPSPSDDSARHALSAAATSASTPALVVASTTKPSRSDNTAHCTPSMAVNCARMAAAASLDAGDGGRSGVTPGGGVTAGGSVTAAGGTTGDGVAAGAGVATGAGGAPCAAGGAENTDVVVGFGDAGLSGSIGGT